MCAICTHLDPFALTDLASVMHPELETGWTILESDAEDSAQEGPRPMLDTISGDSNRNNLNGTSGDDEFYSGDGVDTV